MNPILHYTKYQLCEALMLLYDYEGDADDATFTIRLNAINTAVAQAQQYIEYKSFIKVLDNSEELE